MYYISASDKELMVNALAEVGVCRRCCQRFAGEKSSFYYNFEENDSNGVDAKRSKGNACVACLGVLQDSYMVDKLEKVVADIESSGYDATKFSLSLSLPICLSLRQHSLWLYLRQRLPYSSTEGMRPEHVVPIKQIWKYFYPDIVASKVSLSHEPGDGAQFFVEIQIEWDKDEMEINHMKSICEEEYKKRAKNVHVYNMGVFSREGVMKSLTNVSTEKFSAHYPCPPLVPDTDFSVSTKMLRTSVYLAGRYCKYSRFLPQTPWFVNGVRKCESSVEEIIGDVLKSITGASELKFLASGREDVDVRMLGSGRPFAVECLNPKKSSFSPEELQHLEESINEVNVGVSVNSLKFTSKSKIKDLKEGEEEKIKTYEALCVTSQEMDPVTLKKLIEVENLELEQETPIRVLHRRSNATRKKIVHSMEVVTEGFVDNVFKLVVVSSAGTYIKELVHGDFGRTKPNLSTLLGCDTDLMALDVVHVGLEWPPQDDYHSFNIILS